MRRAILERRPSVDVHSIRSPSSDKSTATTQHVSSPEWLKRICLGSSENQAIGKPRRAPMRLWVKSKDILNRERARSLSNSCVPEAIVPRMPSISPRISQEFIDFCINAVNNVGFNDKEICAAVSLFCYKTSENISTWEEIVKRILRSNGDRDNR